MGDKRPPVRADLVEEIDVLLRILEARPDQADVARKLEWLVDALVIRGQLPKDYSKRAMKIRADRSSVRLTLVTDKYAKDIPDIDCAARLHLCKARCCRFEVSLSEQ